jgi:hypothetical protein
MSTKCKSPTAARMKDEQVAAITENVIFSIFDAEKNQM